jgi:hypothetical protein
MNQKEIKELVYNYKTESKFGFHKDEIDELLKNFPNINMDKFYNAQNGNTCMSDKKGTIIYRCDIHKAILCGIENRDLKIEEWD